MFQFVHWWCISHAWNTSSFCVKGWEVNLQKKPFTCLLHTKNTVCNNLWTLWILWILWCKRSSSCEFDGSQLVTQQLCAAQFLYRLRSGAIMQRGRNLLCESKLSPQCTLTVALLQTYRPTSIGWNLAARLRSVAGLRDKLTAGRRKLQLSDRKTQENGYFSLDIMSVSLRRNCLIWWCREELLWDIWQNVKSTWPLHPCGCHWRPVDVALCLMTCQATSG
jgi:hypothetical protein